MLKSVDFARHMLFTYRRELGDTVYLLYVNCSVVSVFTVRLHVMQRTVFQGLSV